MDWNEIITVFDATDPGLAEDLIAEIYRELGVSGVVITDPLLEAEDEWADPPDARASEHSVSGYIPSDQPVEWFRGILKERLKMLGSQIPFTFRIFTRQTAEKNWAEIWKEHFHPVKITENIVVKPSWRGYDAQKDELIVHLDPGMAFGTGTHPTTAMSAQLLQKFIKAGDSFIDLGTGSGILMIIGAKLGAATGLGTDTNETAVTVARQNLRLNDVSAEDFTVQTGSLAEGIDRRFDLATANITPRIVLSLIEDLNRILKKGGIFICSGFLEHDIGPISRKMNSFGFRILTTRQKERWGAVAGVLDLL